MHIKAKEFALNGNIEVGGIADLVDEPAENYQEESTSGYAERTPPTPKQRKTSNVVLASLALFFLAFIVAMIVIFWVKGSVPDTLIQYTMGAGGLEALVLAGIKVSKVFAGDKSNSSPPDGGG